MQLIKVCLDHLKAERELLERFVELSSQINESLGNNMFPSDELFTSAEADLIKQAEKIGEDRVEIVNQISQHLMVPVEEATIRAIAETLPESQAQPLMAERDKILKMYKHISALSESNVLLLQQSVDIYQRILQSLAGQPTRSQTYSASGLPSGYAAVSLVSKQG